MLLGPRNRAALVLNSRPRASKRQGRCPLQGAKGNAPVGGGRMPREGLFFFFFEIVDD